MEIEQNIVESLLGGFGSMQIATLFPIPFLLAFIFYNHNKVESKAPLVIAVIMIYCLSVFTGMVTGMAGWLGDKPSAIVAGIIAPIGYGLLFTLILSRWFRPKKQLTDHLIES